MSCNRERLVRIIARMADEVVARKEYLTELDAKIGDADHGVNLNRGFEAVRAKLPGLEATCIGTILKTTGMTLLSTVGGASGPLYGTALMDAGIKMMGKESIARDDLRIIIQAALSGIMRRGKAVSGEKTMVDTLAPVIEYLNGPAFRNAPDWETVKNEILSRARRGMESTAALKATKGRASFLGERSIGTLDPGAVSCYFLIKIALETE